MKEYRDGILLFELTDQDLASLGIPLGPRKKLLKALQGNAAPPAPVETAPAKETSAERRQDAGSQHADSDRLRLRLHQAAEQKSQRGAYLPSKHAAECSAQ